MSIAIMNTRPPEPPALVEDPYSIEVLDNPFPFQALLRDAAPVVRLEKYGVYAVGRYDSVRTVMSDWKRFDSGGGSGIQDIRKPGLFRTPTGITDVDPPDHTATRSVLSRILSPVKVRKWREGFEKEAAAIADRLVAEGRFDGVTDVAEAFVFKVFGDAMGLAIPAEKALAIAEMRFNQSGPPNALYHASMERAKPYLDWYDSSCIRENVIPGGVADEIYQAADAGLLTPALATGLVRTLLGGGTDTTIAGIGFTLKRLAENPEQWAAVKEDPRLVKGAFEEAIRLDCPQQIVYRTVKDEMEFEGYHLEQSAKIAMFLGAANRDPRQWAEPESYDVRRDTTGIHLALGSGIHVCIGQMLARLEAECILTAVVQRARALTLAGAPVYRLMNQVRALRSLPLDIEPA